MSGGGAEQPRRVRKGLEMFPPLVVLCRKQGFLAKANSDRKILATKGESEAGEQRMDKLRRTPATPPAHFRRQELLSPHDDVIHEGPQCLRRRRPLVYLPS